LSDRSKADAWNYRFNCSTNFVDSEPLLCTLCVQGCIIIIMSKVLIATIYQHYSVMASSNKFSIEKIILLIDNNPDEIMNNNIKLIEESLGSIMKIEKVKTDLYDIVNVATQAVEVIDGLPEKDEIYIDITSGRKPKSLGLLFGAYARAKKIKRICYVTEDTKQIIRLPKMSYTANKNECFILHQIQNKPGISTVEIAGMLEINKSLVYRYIKELIEIDAVDKENDSLELTDFGRILLL